MFSIVIYASKPSKTPYLSILNFNLKINFSKFSSKEVKFYVLENYFLKKGVVQQLHMLAEV